MQFLHKEINSKHGYCIRRSVWPPAQGLHTKYIRSRIPQRSSVLLSRLPFPPGVSLDPDRLCVSASVSPPPASVSAPAPSVQSQYHFRDRTNRVCICL